MSAEVTSRYVSLLPRGTVLPAVDEDGTVIDGIVEKFRFVEYTYPSGDTSHDIEFLIFWKDGKRDWISFSEANSYGPQRPPRTPHMYGKSHPHSRLTPVPA